MLVLSRKLMESIHINNTIVVKVLTIRGGRVRLGIEAPAEIPVHRTEVFQAISESLDNPVGASEGEKPNRW
jgi:carbon storage regulator